MASLPPKTLAEHYRLIGHFKGDGVGTWRSEFVIRDSTGIPAADSSVVTACVNYWLANLRHDCTLDHIEMRAWAQGDQPFSSQSALYTSVVAALGQKTTTYGGEAANAIGIEVCAYVRFDNAGPRPGKQFLRQLLDTGDIAAVPGGPWVTLPSGASPRVTPLTFGTLSAVVALDDFIGAADPGLRVVHFSLKEWESDHTTNPFSTVVTQIAYIGPTVNKATRKNPK